MRGEGLLSFCNGCEGGSIRCNGRGKQGKDALSVCAQGLCKDAKPTKHTQTLTLRKARCDSADAKQAHTDVVVTKGERDGAKQGVVRFWKEWCSNPSGSRPNSFGRQHLTFDKGGKGDGARRGIIVFLQWL